MEAITMKNIGIWLLALLESIIVFCAFWLGKITDGLDPAFGILIGSVLSASQVLIVLLIRKYFKVDE